MFSVEFCCSALKRHLCDCAFGVRTFWYAFLKDRFDLIAELGFHGEAALIAFENGETDILFSVPPSELDRLMEDSRFILYGGGCPVQGQLIFNMNHPLWGEGRRGSRYRREQR